jgi:hypothetical protein
MASIESGALTEHFYKFPHLTHGGTLQFQGPIGNFVRVDGCRQDDEVCLGRRKLEQ